MSTMPRALQEDDPFALRNMHTAGKPSLAVSDSMQLLIERIGQDLASCEKDDQSSRIGERDVWARRYVAALHMLIMLPFCRLHDIAETCGCNMDEAATVVSDILRDPEAAKLLEEFRGDLPYRRITIQPIVDYGAVDAFLKGTYRYPFTVGIYPAVTCMLSCSFCGRARGAKYKQEDIGPGNELLAQLFAEAPRDLPRRFYLSGGLEPLTNPGLAKLVSFAASLGHRMQLYTNGMMLTPQFLGNNEGLWDLETVRISMYGADDETAQFTTSRSGVATRVLANARDFVRLKSERRATLRVGFNHVVQTGQVGHLRKIASAIVAIADQSPDRKGVNLLTLRENYAASGGAAIRGDERKQLRDELIALQEFFVAEGMSDLEVDLGYGMRGLVEGCETEPVRQVAHTEMLGRGYPQISVVVDLLGDVYLYREAAFIGREGADRYIIGRVTPELGLAEVLQRYCAERDHAAVPRPGDELFLDAFDHAVTAFLRQAGDDLHFGTALSGISIPNNPYLVPNNLWR